MSKIAFDLMEQARKEHFEQLARTTEVKVVFNLNNAVATKLALKCYLAANEANPQSPERDELTIIIHEAIAAIVDALGKC